ncbi:MAG: hypothetical protein RLZZ436_821 [Planctomycetota bacterium]
MSGAGEFSGVASEGCGVRGFECGSELQIGGLERERDNSLAHTTGGTVNSDFESHGICDLLIQPLER